MSSFVDNVDFGYELQEDIEKEAPTIIPEKNLKNKIFKTFLIITNIVMSQHNYKPNIFFFVYNVDFG